MNKDIKDVINSDVLVIGGGTAGFGAAVAAARQGLNVYLMEATDKLGGVMAKCPGMPIADAYPKDKPMGGILEEYLNRLYNMDPPAAEKRKCYEAGYGPEVHYDCALAQLTLFQMLEEAGVNLILNTTAIEPIMDENKVKGVIYYNKTGEHNIFSKILIDCSGDGDITAKAGVPFEMGEEINGHMMAVALTFYLSNVDKDRIPDSDDPYHRKIAEKGIKSGRLHKDFHGIYWMPGLHVNSLFFNAVNILNIDGTKPQEVTKATIKAMKVAHQLVSFLKEEIPGFENAYIESMGSRVGVRETRRFEGMYKITADDLFIGKKFSDGILCSDAAVDDVARGSYAASKTISLIDKGVCYQIPYRCLVPKKIENLLFAGRLISADSVAMASTRSMAMCMGMGHACGVAADLAIKNNKFVQDIDFDELIKKLQEQGVHGLAGEKL